MQHAWEEEEFIQNLTQKLYGKRLLEDPDVGERRLIE
jgi:hypothetical protein